MTAPWGSPVGPPVLAAGAGERPCLETVPGPRLHELVGSARRGERELLGAAGALLRALHEARPPVGEPAAFEFPPWRPLPFEVWLGLSAAQALVVGRVHRSGAAREELERLEEALTAGPVWCHGDARADNFCVRRAVGPVLVDWERSGRGSREADLAALCGSVVGAAVLRATGPGVPRGPAALDALGGELGAARAQVAAILAGYGWAEFAGVGDVTLARAVGAHVLCRALARTAYHSLDRPAGFLLEIGLGLVVRPEGWHALAG